MQQPFHASITPDHSDSCSDDAEEDLLSVAQRPLVELGRLIKKFRFGRR